MTLDEIKTLIGWMGSSDLAALEVAKGGWTLKLVRHAPAAAPAPPVPPAPSAPPPGPAGRSTPPAPAPAAGTPAADVRAPLAGIVYLSPSPDAPLFATVGGTVEAGALLCTVEAMKTFNEVRADRAGTLRAVLVGAGDEVEAGQPLFRIG